MSAEKDSFRGTLLHFEKIMKTAFLTPCTYACFTSLFKQSILCNGVNVRTPTVTQRVSRIQRILRWALKRSGDLLLTSFTATPVSLHWQRQIYGWEQQAAQPFVMHTLTDPLNVLYSQCYSQQTLESAKWIRKLLKNELGNFTSLWCYCDAETSEQNQELSSGM